jgi:hypothetical protein
MTGNISGGGFCRPAASAATDAAAPHICALYFFACRSPSNSNALRPQFQRISTRRIVAMSAQEKSHRYEAWTGGVADIRDTEPGPIDCDCGDTIRELLIEIVATAAVFLLIILVLHALI